MIFFNTVVNYLKVKFLYINKFKIRTWNFILVQHFTVSKTNRKHRNMDTREAEPQWDRKLLSEGQ